MTFRTFISHGQKKLLVSEVPEQFRYYLYLFPGGLAVGIFLTQRGLAGIRFGVSINEAGDKEMIKYLIIGLGGFIGAIARYYFSGLAQNAFGNTGFFLFPLGTMAVNVLGCLLLGFTAGLLTERQLDPDFRYLVNIGFLGAFTTFSTFSLETLNLLEEGDYGYGLLNVLLSVVLGLGAAWLGRVIYRTIWG